MIGLLEGTVVAKNKNPLILKVGGVGYAVHVPDRLLSKLTLNQPTTVFVHTHVREDSLMLFGFSTTQELALFELLLTVPGIGPRIALAVVDRGVAAVEKAITTGDVDFFTTIPRMGKKNAQKIIIELRTKLGAVADLDLTEDATGETKEVLEALLSMGFERKEALAVIKSLSENDVTLEQKVRSALKLLGK